MLTLNKRVSEVVVGIVISIGLLYVHPAYAHNFASDESAHFLGKVVNLEAEMQALKMDLSDPTAVSWHISKINSYWTTNDTQQMAERNQLLSNEIPKTINDIITAARAPSPDSGTISQQIDALNGYLDEGIPVRIDKDKMQNGTVQALADTDIIKETLADYGIAINSQVDLNDMSKMESMGSMSMGANQTSSSSAGAGSSGQTIMMSKGAGSGQACVSSKNCFDPSTLTVSPGDTVTWKNMDTVSHTVTSGNPTDNQTGTVFDSGLVKPGDTFTFTFKDAGTYHYFCQVHPWMTGMVVVGQGGMSGMKMGTSYSQNDAAPIHLVQMSGMSSSGSMSGMGGTSGGGSGMNMQSSSATTGTLCNMAAYHSSQTHAPAMISFFD